MTTDSPAIGKRPRFGVSRVIALVVLTAAAVVFFMPPPEGQDPRLMRGAALIVMAVGLYATSIIPEFLTALLFFLLAMLFAVAPAAVVFSGFASTALWLVFGGLVIGVAVRRTGLGEYVATAVVARFGGSWLALVTGMVLVGVALSFLVPSTLGRVVLLIPVVLALCDRLGFVPGSRGRDGLILAMALGTWMPSTGILPANVVNMVLAGAAETLWGIHLTYGRYLLLHFPVGGILKAIAIVLVVTVMFRDRPGPGAAIAGHEAGRRLGRDGRLLALTLVVALGFWATDFLHGISPAWISLAAGVFCMLPGIGLVPVADFNARVNFGSVVYVAGILALGTVAADTGVGDWFGRQVIAVLPLSPGNAPLSFASLVGLSVAVGAAVTMPGVPAVLGPLAGELAAATGFSVETVIMTQVVGYSLVIMPYQMPAVFVAMQLGGLGVMPATRLLLVLAAITALLLAPLTWLWWCALGVFGASVC